MARYKKLKDGTFQKIEESETRWDKNEDGMFAKRKANVVRKENETRRDAFLASQILKPLYPDPVRTTGNSVAIAPMVRTTGKNTLTQENARLQAEKNIQNKYGTYEQYQKNGKSESRIPLSDSMKQLAGKTSYEQLIKEETKRLMSDSNYFGLTNDTYQQYLDNLEKNAKEQKQFDWLKEQKKNLEAMSLDNAGKKYKGKNTREWVEEYVKQSANPLNYMQKYDAEDALGELGYSEKEIKSMADTYKREQNAKRNEEQLKWADELQDGGFWGDLTAQTLSYGAGFASAPSFLASGMNTIKEAVTGKYSPLDTNEYMFASGDFRDRVRQNSVQNLTHADEYAEKGEKVPLWRKGLGWIYQGGSSFLESQMLNMAIPSGALAVMGAEAFGSSSKDAFERTGNNIKAMATGAVSGDIEALTENTGLDYVWDIMQGSGKAAMRSALANLLAQSTIEGVEELSSEGLNTFTDWIINRADSNLERNVQSYKADGLSEKKAWGAAILDAVKQAGEAGLVGALSGAMGGGMATAMSPTTNGKAGFTQNEKKVVDVVTEQRISEAESDGKKLTAKEKTNIQQEVKRELEKGYISIDTIEEALGGDTYNQYKTVSEQDESLLKEFNTLNQMKQGEMTGEQIDRRMELKKQLEEFKQSDNKTKLKERLSKEVADMTLNDMRLRESYNEKGRRSQEFTADVSKYHAKQQETIQKAIDSKILNNTNRTHEFVDMIAKISADKGVSFDFTNNERLRESGFVLEGRRINGYVQGNDITLNIDSAKALNKVVGHEITHVLEGTEHYEALAEAVKAYAEIKGEYQSRYDALAKLYKDMEGANIENELTADLIGDYLFTDEKFVQQLSTKNQNLFQKIFHEIKYLVKTATAGSKEARQLEKVKRAFEKAYRETSENTTNSSEVLYSLYADENIRQKAEQFKKEGYKNFERVKVLDMTPRIQTEVKRLVGFDATGYEIYSNTDTYKHIENRHGESGKHDHSMKDLRDVALMPYVLENFDSAEIVLNGKGEIDTTSAFQDKNGNPAKMIKFSKEIDGVQYVVIAAAENNYKRLWVLSEYKVQKKDTSQTSYGNEALPPTPEANPDNVSSLKDVTEDIMNSYGQNPKFQFLRTSSTDSISPNQKNATGKIQHSLSKENRNIAPTDSRLTYGRDIALEKIAPAQRNERIINKLTGKELDSRTYDILERLDRGESVEASEIEGLKEVKEGKIKVDELLKEFVSQNPRFEKLPLNDVGTYLLDSEERIQLRNSIIESRLQEGSFSGIDENGKELYNGKVERNRRLDIVIGLPASGKSSAIVNPLSEFYHSTVVDSDIIKQMLPEYNDGWGASLVHEESSDINLDFLKESMKIGNNIVLPIVGAKTSSVKNYIVLAQKAGYSVNLHLNELPSGKAVGRLLKRYFHTGRFINPVYAAGYGNKPTAVYETMKGRSDISGYSRWNNDVAYGQRPGRTEISANNRVYGQYSDSWGSTGREKIERNDRGVQQAQSRKIAPEPQGRRTSSSDGVFFGGENRNIAPIGQDIHAKTDNQDGNLRKWVETSTESDAVNREVLPDNLDPAKIYYEPVTNKDTLGKANADLGRMGYEKSLTVFRSKLEARNVSLSDVALGERLVQEAIKLGDKKTAGELIQDISILGTELGQKVQALSIIRRLTPEGQLGMLQKLVERGKAKGDPAFTDVEVTQEMTDTILGVYEEDGSFDQDRLNEAVEKVKQQIADQMPVSLMEKANAWRYLSMLGNPKTHIRNLVSNAVMAVAVEAKNATARTMESVGHVKSRTKTWKRATQEVRQYARETTAEMAGILSGENSYSENVSIKSKRSIFKNKILEGLCDFNSDMLSKEDWWFKKSAFRRSFQEFLTANGVNTQEDIQNNREIVEKAKKYAVEQAQIATFQQYSWLASKIGEIEQKNKATQIAVGAVLPFKKTPVNIAKTGLFYSPLGFTKTLTYDLYQMKQGKMEASTVVDHLSQNLVGSALVYAGYMLAMAGVLHGGGEEDKEAKYDYQLGEQSYSLRIGENTYSLSWLSPAAIPLFVGANFHEIFDQEKELTFDATVDSLAKTLDPMSEMSFLSSLDSVLSSYDSGVEKFAGIGETMLQSYVSQYIPTLSSQAAAAIDDTKRSTKVAGNSKAKLPEETLNKLFYKIPLLREVLEPSTDIWGNEIRQPRNLAERALESFFAPYAKREDITTETDRKLKKLYSQTGEALVLPRIPSNSVRFKGKTYRMSAKEYTDYKKTYGWTAYELLGELFESDMYRNADVDEQVKLVRKVYDYAREQAKKEFFDKNGVEYTN